MEKQKTLIIGKGEIGVSLAKVLSSVYDVFIRDRHTFEEIEKNHYDVVNICYPYSENFVEQTKEYIENYKPRLTIIHSTVKPGTTRACGKHVVHSPVNGKHPLLEESLLKFVKVVAGSNSYSTFEAVHYLNQAGIKTLVFSSPETSELAKILCTTQFGVNIILMKEIVRICEKYKVPFHEVYTEWNNIYNSGYVRMNENRFYRNILFPIDGPIGGHCVIANCELLDDFLTFFVKTRNEQYRKNLVQSIQEDKNLASGIISHSDKQNRPELRNSQPRLDWKGRIHRKPRKD